MAALRFLPPLRLPPGLRALRPGLPRLRRVDLGGLPAPEVGRPLAAIGDVHGMDALLGRLLDTLALRAPDALPLFLGDLIDRGPDSDRVLARVRTLEAAGKALCLLGNHEQMLLDAIDRPATGVRRWLGHGGGATLRSFGLEPPQVGAPPEALEDLAGALARALGAEMLGWLRARPLLHREGTLVAAHAGLDPARPPETQERHRLLWGGPLPPGPRADGLWVVQGHDVVPVPLRRGTCLRIDTGAFASGRLSALVLRPGQAPAVLTRR
ncbi:metallophosphoesterase [Frigidibacter sp. MR17.14]|uniref:metallophosphoesterase n=1 Tax=Frigidibacter sp. MR17.14 TaxID=3126509 RepID=UPI003012BFB5